MNKLFTKIAALALGAAMVVGVGVSVGSKGASSSFANDEIYNTVEFLKGNCTTGYNDYTHTLVYSDDIVVNCENFNCSYQKGSAGWDFIKCGRKNYTSVASIITSSAIGEAITKVSVTIDSITSNKVNSIKLYTSSNGSTWTAESTEYTKSTGEQAVSVTSPAANKYYKVEFDCASHTANGFVQVSRIDYYHDDGGPSTEPLTTPTLTKTNNSLSWTSVDNANSYELKVDNSVVYTGSSTSYNLTSAQVAQGYHTASVVAKPASTDTSHTDSAEGTTSWTVFDHAGTLADPYSVADASAAIDGNTGTTDVYVAGVVSEIVTPWGEGGYQNITFDIKDEGGSSTFRVYRCVDGTADASEVRVDDVVVAHGNLTKYNDTYEFTAGCTLEVLTHPAVATLLIENLNKIAPHGVARSIKGTIENDENYTITWSCATSGVTINPSTSSSNESVSVTVANTVAVGTEITVVGTLSDAGAHNASTTFVVSSKAADSVANALTASEAGTLVGTGKIDGTLLYVKGYVTECQANRKFFWLGDEKGTTKSFEIYNADNSDFSGLTTLNAFVVAHGSALKYNSTAEIADSVIDSSDYFEIASNSLEVQSGSSETITVSNASGNVSWSKVAGSGDIALSETSNTGATVTGTSAGSATITITVGNYSEQINVTVTPPPATVTGLTVYDEGLNELSDHDIVELDAQASSSVSTDIMCEVSYSDSTTGYEATIVSSPSDGFSTSYSNEIYTLTFTKNEDFDVTISAGSFSINVTYSVTGVEEPDEWPLVGQYIVWSEGEYTASQVHYTYKTEFSGISENLGQASEYVFKPKAVTVLTVSKATNFGEYLISYNNGGTQEYLTVSKKNTLSSTTDLSDVNTAWTFSTGVNGYVAENVNFSDGTYQGYKLQFNPNSGNYRFAAYRTAQKEATFVLYDKTAKAGEFTEKYMHVEIPTTETGESTGYQTCKQTGYYDTAKTNFNLLGDDVREEFATNSVFADYFERLVDWAHANTDEFGSNGGKDYILYAFVPRIGIISGLNEIVAGNGTTIIIIVSVIGVSALGGFFFLRKRKEI